MTTPATNIQEAIDLAADNIAELAYDGIVSLAARMVDWTDGMFVGPAGIYVDVQSDNQRRVLDWFGATRRAQAEIEGPNPGDAGLIGTSAVIDAVTRALCAVRDSALAGAISSAQETDTVTLFNTAWT
ncbi:MAG TPA: hypothetical protein VK081_03630 [Planctomycetota bacterium]|nr:hypothetical protein [Planctomycetota bacterium]